MRKIFFSFPLSNGNAQHSSLSVVMKRETGILPKCRYHQDGGLLANLEISNNLQNVANRF
jgi:hypothetical protein